MGKRAEDSVRVNITLPVMVKEAMAEYAAKSRRSMSELMAEAIEEKARQIKEEELRRELAEAYRDISGDLQQEVAEWDPVSREAWERAYADEEQDGKSPNERRPGHADTSR